MWDLEFVASTVAATVLTTLVRWALAWAWREWRAGTPRLRGGDVFELW